MSVVRHTIYNGLGSLTPILVTLVTVPIYVHAIGVERYGILSLCWLLAGYFTFLDFGIGRATAQRMSSNRNSTASARNVIFWSSLSLSALLAVFGFAIALAIGSAFLGRMDASPKLVEEIGVSLVALALAVPLGILQNLLAGILEGRQSFGALNVILAIGTVLTAGLPLMAALYFGPHLFNLIVATLIARSTTVLLLANRCRIDVPILAPDRPEPIEVRALLGFGGWATVTAIAGPILVYFDRFAIGALLGGAAVAYYVIGFNIIMQMLLVPTSFSRALFPRFASLERAESAKQGAEALHLLLLAAMVMATLAMALISPFFKVWLGAEIATKSAPVTVVLLIGFWANAAAQSAFTHLQAKARPDLPAKAHLVELLPYIALFYLLTIKFGLLGSAIAWSLRALFDFAILQTIDNLNRRLLRLIGITCGVVMTGAIVQFVIDDPWIRLCAGIAVFAAAVEFARRSAPQIATAKVSAVLARLRPSQELQP